MRLAYHYRNNIATTPDGPARHERILELLSRLRTEARITAAQDVETAFPTKEAEQQLFDRLRDFAGRHKVGLARVFGSNRYGFCYLPTEFLLVYEGDDLCEVFPCEIGDALVSPLQYLEEVLAGRPWTTRSVRGGEGKRHAALVAQICASPDLLEPGLRLRGQSVQVSRDFAQLGFVDLVFEDSAGRTLLVEVKVEPPELDKAIGQILRHQHLFAHQNNMSKDSVRVGMACPSIPWPYRAICEEHGISCFPIPKTGGPT